MDVKALMLHGALVRVGGRQLPHARDLQDEAPLVSVGEIAEVSQETHELGPAVGVDLDQLAAPEEEAHLGGPVLERGRGVVEGGCPTTEDRDPLAPQTLEVDVGAGVGVKAARKSLLDQGGDLPLPRALD